MIDSSRTLSGTPLNPIGLGCMSLSQAYYPLPSEEEGIRLLNKAIDLGIAHLDTARLYGLGHNEALLSRVLKSRRDEVFLASKCGIEAEGPKRSIDCKPATIRRAVETSLKTLNVDFIDLYYLHRRDKYVPIEESVGTLADLKSEGKIGAIGLSEMSAETLGKAAAEHPIAAMQSEYSLWTRNPEIAVLEACKKLKTAFIAFSPLGRGVLAKGLDDATRLDKRDLRVKHPRFNEDNWPKNRGLMDRFEALARKANITPAQLSLAWVLNQGSHVHVIPGTTNLDHLEENLATLSIEVPSDLLKQAGEIVNNTSVSGHRYPEKLRAAIDTEEFDAC